MKRLTHYVIKLVFLFSGAFIWGADGIGKFNSHRDFFSFYARQKAAINEYLDSMEESERLSLLFLVNVCDDTSFYPVEKASAVIEGSKLPLVPGGCLLFSYNIGENPQQLKSYIDSINNFYKENGLSKPYVAVDQEGGLVNRLRGITEYLPSSQKVAKTRNPQEAFSLYLKQAQQMASLGITMNLAPVAETLTPKNKDFLNTRSFGGFTETCIYSVLFIKAFQENGVGAVVKHFPGNTNADPHAFLPVIDESKSYVDKNILMPFRFVMGAKPHAVLMSHAMVNYPGSGETVPSCLSPYWINGVIKENFGYDGLVISDDIFMAALAKSGWPAEKALIQAFKSGIHVIMLSEKTFGDAARIIYKTSRDDEEFAEIIRNAQVKVLEYKINTGLMFFKTDQNGKLILVNSYGEE